MTEYRLYILGADGRIRSGFGLQCADDEEARAACREHLAEHVIELWSGARFVARFEPGVQQGPTKDD